MLGISTGGMEGREYRARRLADKQDRLAREETGAVTWSAETRERALEAHRRAMSLREESARLHEDGARLREDAAALLRGHPNGEEAVGE